MHYGGDLPVRRASTKVEIDLELLTMVTPFVLATDENLVVTWASRAVLKRVQEAVGMNVTELIESGDPPEEISSQLLAKKIGQIRKLTFFQGKSRIPLIGRWLSCHDGFLLLATPDAKISEDLLFFSFDDFPQESRLVELLVGRDETRVSLKEAASAVMALKEKNKELEKSQGELNQKMREVDDQQRAILNMIKDTEASRQQLELTNAALKSEITERKKAEQRQAELLEQLEKTNQELKDFAYIVSHDLKAPLRGIKTLAEWISTDYADKLDDNGKEQMNLLAGRVDRMHNLIDGILQYSRVGHVEEEKVVVNLNELVTEAIDMIAPPENITITIENELPTIKCERTRITQVFQNLLSNAVKYMDKPKGQIKVGCVEEDGFWKFSVADNGRGIEEKHYEKIFQLFQTLAPRDESESTGIGLTVTKKIVEMYGGKTWVQSKVGSGSTFFFTLPKTLSVTDNQEQLLTTSSC
jgi:signal transduction histidine kinase